MQVLLLHHIEGHLFLILYLIISLKFYCFSEFKICLKITGSHRMGNLWGKLAFVSIDYFVLVFIFFLIDL